MLKSHVNISVVDDEPSVRKALGRLFQSVGFIVETFATGREFLDSLKYGLPACVVLDLQLQGLSGLEVQAHLVREKLNLPVIIITGRDEPGISERVRASGAAAYLKKPVDEETLLAAIDSVTNPNQLKKKPESGEAALSGTKPANQLLTVED